MQAGSLLWRRRNPVAVAAVDSILGIGQTAAGVPLHVAVTPVAVMMLVSWSVGAHERRRRALLGLARLVVGAWSTMTVAAGNGEHYGATDYPWIGLLISMPWLVGHLFHGRTRSLREAARRAARLERERLVAVAEERARIARELHDVIAHSVSVMTVQAGAAEAMLAHDPARALEPVQAVQETGRRAHVEMKRLVGMLRERDEALGLEPQPGLADVDELLAGVRAAGLPVELRVEGTARELPLGIDLSAYRIVQEALTNALKHAGRASASVLLRYDERTLEIEVADDGAGAGGANGGGHGLEGMRERVSVFGGEFEAGPAETGGFVVRARLPVEATA
jgi:signal transduction histidine kinase